MSTTPTYGLGHIVYMRYQGDVGPDGNRGKVVAISEQEGGGYHYTVETSSGWLHTGLTDDTLSPRPMPEPTIETAVRALNEAFAADPVAVHALICNRVPCNGALAAHPSVIVEPAHAVGRPEESTVGLLGILNGVLEPMTGKRVATRWDTDSQPPRLLGFQAYDPAVEELR